MSDTESTSALVQGSSVEASEDGTKWARLVAEIADGSMSLGEEAARFDRDRRDFREQFHTAPRKLKHTSYLSPTKNPSIPSAVRRTISVAMTANNSTSRPGKRSRANA